MNKQNAGPAMVSGFGQYHTNEADPSNPGKKLTPYVPITWEEIQAMVDETTSVLKPEARWFIPSTLKSRSKVKQKVEGRYLALWADFDHDPKPLSEISDMLDFMVLGYDTNREQYNSRSATVAKPKSRALVPLAKPLCGVDWILCQRVFNDLLRACDLKPDAVTENENQICYLPNRGEFYEVLSKRDGVMFDPFKGWATQIEAKLAEIAAEVEAERVLRAQRAEARRRRAAMREATGTAGLGTIEATRESYTPDQWLIEAGYDQRGDSFRHPGSQSGSYSASMRESADGVLRVHSLSSSDPLYTGGGGGGAHDSASVFAVLFHGGNMDAALKDLGDNFLKIGNESWNKVRRREYMQSKSATTDDFDEVSGDEEEIDPDTGEIKKKIHPLARFINYEVEALAPECVLPGFIGLGIVTIAGSAGVGKTSTLLPLAMAAAGLHEFDYDLAPKPDRWRHVIYITEDTAQAKRIVAGMLGSADLGLDKAQVLERLHIVEAIRLDVAVVAKVGKVYRREFCRLVQGIEIMPLVVVDTRAAVLASDDENSNSEASRIVNVLKQGFEHLPVWIVGHIAKQNVGRSDLASLSMRGGSAFEADANQCLYIIKEGAEGSEQRYMVRGKTRFEAKWPELAIQSFTSTTMAKDAFGDEEKVTLRWAIASPGLQTRAQAKAKTQETAKREREGEMGDEVQDAVAAAWEAGKPLNRGAVKAKLGGKGETIGRIIESQLVDGWLYEVPIPPGQRTHPMRGSFLVALNLGEHDEYMKSGKVPAAKLVIPPSWKKPSPDGTGGAPATGSETPVSSVPEGEPVLATEGVKK